MHLKKSFCQFDCEMSFNLMFGLVLSVSCFTENISESLYLHSITIQLKFDGYGAQIVFIQQNNSHQSITPRELWCVTEWSSRCKDMQLVSPPAETRNWVDNFPEWICHHQNMICMAEKIFIFICHNLEVDFFVYPSFSYTMIFDETSCSVCFAFRRFSFHFSIPGQVSQL